MKQGPKFWTFQLPIRVKLLSSLISGFGILIKRHNNNNNNNTNVSWKLYYVAIACASMYQLCCVMLNGTPLSTAGKVLFIFIKCHSNNNNANVSWKLYSVAMAYAGIYQLCCVMLSGTPFSKAGKVLFISTAARGKHRWSRGLQKAAEIPRCGEWGW